MTQNLLEQLAERVVPPPPRDLNTEIHQRINSRLLYRHLVDFGIQGLAVALLHFFQAMVGAIWYSLTGTDLTPNNPNRKDPNDE